MEEKPLHVVVPIEVYETVNRVGNNSKKEGVIALVRYFDMNLGDIMLKQDQLIADQNEVIQTQKKLIQSLRDKLDTSVKK